MCGIICICMLGNMVNGRFCYTSPFPLISFPNAKERFHINRLVQKYLFPFPIPSSNWHGHYVFLRKCSEFHQFGRITLDSQVVVFYQLLFSLKTRPWLQEIPRLSSRIHRVLVRKSLFVGRCSDNRYCLYNDRFRLPTWRVWHSSVNCSRKRSWHEFLCKQISSTY